MLDLSYRTLGLHVQHPMSSSIRGKDCQTMIKTATKATSSLDKIVATTSTSTGATPSTTSGPSVGTVCPAAGTNPSRVVGVSAGKLDRLLEKLANAARRELDHDHQPAKSGAQEAQLTGCSRSAASCTDRSTEHSFDEATIGGSECNVTTNRDPTHRSIEPEPAAAAEVEERHRPQTVPLTSSADTIAALVRADKRSASTSTLTTTPTLVASSAASSTTASAATISTEAKSNSSSRSNLLNNSKQDIKLDDSQTLHQLMLAVLNMSQKNMAKMNKRPTSELTIVGGVDVLDTDEDESDALPDLKAKLSTATSHTMAGTTRRRAGSVHDSSNEECSAIYSAGSNSSALSNTSASKSDDANHALTQRRRSLAHSTSTLHDRRHETTNSSHDPNGQQQQQQQHHQQQHQQHQQQQQQHKQQKHNPPQQCESSTLTRPSPQVATDSEQVVPKFSHSLPFDLNGRQNKTHNSSNSSSTISPSSFVTISSSNTTTPAMRATTPNATFVPGTMDPSLLTSYLLSQAQFNHEQSAFLNLAQQYQILGSLARAPKRARMEESVVEDTTTNDLAAKLLNQLIYAQRPVTATNHHVDSPLDLSVKTPSPQPAGSPRSVSPIDPVLLARLHQQQQLIASHQAFKRRSSGSSTLSEFTSSLPSTPTTPASLLSQQALHATIFDPSLIFSDQTQLKIDTRIDSTRRSRKTQNVKPSQKQVSPSHSPRSELSSDSPSAVGECHACHLCGQTFAFYDRLAKHIASRHKVKTSPTQGLDASGRAYNCDICNRSFARSDMLTRHMRLHTGIKPYTCGVCQQVFSRSDHLSTHQRTHTGEKPYKCPQCPYAACRRDMITRHMKTHSRYEMPDSSSSAASPMAASPIH